MNILELKSKCIDQAVLAKLTVQLQSTNTKQTKDNKPYLEVVFADATGSMKLNIWSGNSTFTVMEQLALNAVVELEGEWTQNQYGLNSTSLKVAQVDDAMLELFFAGDPVLKAKQDEDYETIQGFCLSLKDPRFHALAQLFLVHFSERFRRTAAAKKNHHARRGGLVEHVAQMMRLAHAVSPLYPNLNRDLLLTGVLFHDCGKLWENSYAEMSFAQNLTLHGEMLGHIPLGIELVNKLWRDLLDTPSASSWKELQPSTEDCRIHLLHLIASHHGEYAFGSPTLPRTPEAFVLHYIDNLDAKMEMVTQALQTSNDLGNGIYEKVFPLPANLVGSLPVF